MHDYYREEGPCIKSAQLVKKFWEKVEKYKKRQKYAELLWLIKIILNLQITITTVHPVQSSSCSDTVA